MRDVVALVYSGYEAETSQLLISTYLARELGLWPPPLEAIETIFSTVGGPIRVWIICKAVKVKVLVENVEAEEVDIDIVVSHLADEPLISNKLTSPVYHVRGLARRDELLISDKLAGALKIVIEDLAEGLRRFRWKPKEKVRRTVQ